MSSLIKGPISEITGSHEKNSASNDKLEGLFFLRKIGKVNSVINKEHGTSKAGNDP